MAVLIALHTHANFSGVGVGVPEKQATNRQKQHVTRRWSPPAPQPTAKRYTPTTTRAGEASQPVWEAFNQTADICAMVEHYGFHHPQKDGEGVRYVSRST